MKNVSAIGVFFSLALLSSMSFAQTTASDHFEEKIKESTFPGAEIGCLACEDAQGNRVLCSGDLSETILGIVTNLPYVTLNKPTDPKGSKFIFRAMVDGSGNGVKKGDLLTAGAAGQLKVSRTGETPYAVALQDATGGRNLIEVKLLK